MDVSFFAAWPGNANGAQRQRRDGFVALMAAIAMHVLALIFALFLHAKPNILQPAWANRGLPVMLTTAMHPASVMPARATPLPRPPKHAPQTAAVLASHHSSTRTVSIAPTRPADTAGAESAENPPSDSVTSSPAPVDATEKSSGRLAESTSIVPALNLPGSQTVMDVAHIECDIPQPVYPPRATRLQHAGSVTIDVTIGTTGQITRAAIARTSGFDELDAAGKDAILAARCKPYIDHGSAVTVHALQSIDFTLRN
ncbi:TonB family protein (plasmid) [Burkholderia sp. FERM BP-3421]|uniref:energy transducer TonB n=1 Tax=Burkholderia sp. FERM BP-3421 TaxID=1494466 RepID=UPI00235EC807|nr:energy transducer TonB [Burkholderia sp. FERM BP-3421]WDD90357.1 TonB family protein [Burkholderia sp. FERM BP-3421]